MNVIDNLPKILPPKDDIVFKMLFGDERNEKTLIAFLNVVLDKNIKKITFLNPQNKQMNEEDKLSILDVKAELDNGEKIDVEMQARNLKEMRSRITFYQSEMIGEQMNSGDSYLKIKPVVSIIVVKDSLITESQKCHNIFLMQEKDEHFPFSDLQEIHILDLSRIKMEKNETLSDWLEFINAEKEEEFMKVAQKNGAIKEAFEELKVLSSDDYQRMLYKARLKVKRDNEAARMFGIEEATQQALQQGMQQGMQQVIAFLSQGHSLEEAKKLFV